MSPGLNGPPQNAETQKTYRDFAAEDRERQVEEGTLVVRQMTPEERKFWGPAKPRAAAKRPRKSSKSHEAPESAGGEPT